MVGRQQQDYRLQELGDFLRTRRAKLTPEEVGLPRGSRRKTPGLIIVFILTSLLLMAWNRLIAHRMVLHRTLLFLIFPISQFALLLAFENFYPQTSSLNHLLASIGAFLGLLADFILLYILLEQGHKEALERKLQELETLRRVEAVHYQAIEARREQLAKIRHDFNNQLTAAYNLISSDREMAGELLDELKTDIAKTKEYAYCANAIVNAVLMEKAAECEEYGIRLTTEIELPEEPSIQAVHQCSVFSNLCDNAIKAAKACAEGNRFVTVRATHNGDYLHVKVENSAPDPKSKKESARKKYGQEILADIASRYDGELNYSWKDGIYSAMLSLTVREASNNQVGFFQNHKCSAFWYSGKVFERIVRVDELLKFRLVGINIEG